MLILKLPPFFPHRIAEWKSAENSKQTFIWSPSIRSYIILALRICTVVKRWPKVRRLQCKYNTTLKYTSCFINNFADLLGIHNCYWPTILVLVSFSSWLLISCWLVHIVRFLIFERMKYLQYSVTKLDYENFWIFLHVHSCPWPTYWLMECMHCGK